MRLFLMFVTAVCVLFLVKLRWPKEKSIQFNIVYNLIQLGLKGLNRKKKFLTTAVCRDMCSDIMDYRWTTV